MAKLHGLEPNQFPTVADLGPAAFRNRVGVTPHPKYPTAIVPEYFTRDNPNASTSVTACSRNNMQIHTGGDSRLIFTNTQGYGIVSGLMEFKHSMGSNQWALYWVQCSRYRVDAVLLAGTLGGGITIDRYQDPNDANINSLRITNNGAYVMNTNIVLWLNANGGLNQLDFPSEVQPVAAI